jgi:hypothetical protein
MPDGIAGFGVPRNLAEYGVLRNTADAGVLYDTADSGMLRNIAMSSVLQREASVGLVTRVSVSSQPARAFLSCHAPKLQVKTRWIPRFWRPRSVKQRADR